ncbi:MAG: cobalamin biosynthesis protein P47K [Pirellulaceae bacterium]|jgi:Ni2+-binding GTPase involved in maturation of urease and hydrogenase|nr:cobalamin biosynthesis protein P47K [Pirellulaceae bacterium]
MSKVRFILVGGFLGAGKTTTIARLAKAYRNQGQNVGIVTNDQATDLVDTHSLRSAGFEVGEVAGSCFCCNFNGLAGAVEHLESRQRPDVILAEPVGSCTDIVATVVQPLRRLYQDKFAVAPYGVILKPSHGRKILKNEPQAGFSPKAAYIFKKQLEEADFVILNRIDELRPHEVDELAGLIAAEHPGIPVVRMSAKMGAGFDGLLEILDQQGNFGGRILELDYDMYAEGEAELGWLNSSLRVTAPGPFSLDDLSLSIVQRLQQSLAATGAEPAHLKTIGMSDGQHGVANLVSSDTPAVLSLASNCHTRRADVIVNARVAVDPQVLEEHVQAAVRATCQSLSATPEFLQTQSFRPGRPNPTYRYVDAV